MPAAFRVAYPTTFCINDATELMCEVPASLCLQSQHYSSQLQISHNSQRILLLNSFLNNGSTGTDIESNVQLEQQLVKSNTKV